MNILSKTLVKQIRESINELAKIKKNRDDYAVSREYAQAEDKLITLIELGEEALCGKIGGHDTIGGQKSHQTFTLEQRANHVINNEHRLNKVVVVHRKIVSVTPKRKSFILAHWLTQPTRLIQKRKK